MLTDKSNCNKHFSARFLFDPSNPVLTNVAFITEAQEEKSLPLQLYTCGYRLGS